MKPDVQGSPLDSCVQRSTSLLHLQQEAAKQSSAGGFAGHVTAYVDSPEHPLFAGHKTWESCCSSTHRQTRNQAHASDHQREGDRRQHQISICFVEAREEQLTKQPSASGADRPKQGTAGIIGKLKAVEQ